MPEPLVPSMLMGGALFGLVFSCEIGPELTCGVGVAAGVEGVSRGPPAPPDAASASASPMEPGPSAGVEAGFEKGLRDPAPGSVERRGGGGRRDSGGGNPGRPGRAVVGELGSFGRDGALAPGFERGSVGGFPKLGSADGIRPPHSTQNTAPSNPSAPQWGHRAERPAMVTAFLPLSPRRAAMKLPPLFAFSHAQT
ncbi:MAG TPA: hypothetical protein VG937_09765 [Polyangiaceae bacterium]|nr:hypothetical protein [Polyangiaceae bacterium]